MTTEREGSSVLARLMGIDRPSPQHTTKWRQRVLSGSYLQNIASISHRRKFMSDANIDDCSMDVSDHVDCGSIPDEGFYVEGCTNMGSPLHHSTVQGLWGVSVVGKHMSSETYLWPSKSDQIYTTGNCTQAYSWNRVEVRNDYDKSSMRVMEPKLQNFNSFVAGKTLLLPYVSSGGTDKKQKTTISVKNKGIDGRQRKLKSLHNNDIQMGIGGFGSPKGVAKQITSQVKDSVWHSCLSDLNKPEKTSSSKSCQFELGKKPELPSYYPPKRSDSRTTLNSQRQPLELRRKRNYSQEARRTHVRRTPGVVSALCTHRRNYTFLSEDSNCCSPARSKMNDCQVGSVRFLSKPSLFPSAWVPRSKERCFTLDTSWCLGPSESNNLCNVSVEENVRHEDKDSTYDPHDSNLDLEKLDLTDKNSSLTYDSVELEKQSALDEILSACDSFSDESGFLDTESPTCHDACEIWKETWNSHMEKDVCQDSSLVSLLTASDFATLSEDTQKINGKENEKLSAKLGESILPDDVAPPAKGFVLKQELKRTSPPGSPVSSLEGPEACRRCLNYTLESKGYFSVPHCSNHDVLGLQTRLSLIEALSLESGSEGPAMIVSSDGGDEGGSVGCYREDTQITECTSENCEFSYLEDVLVESGILMGNMDVDDGTYSHRGYVLNPSVFDSLEKKYGKSAVSGRSDRKLLFDRINSGLMEIFQPSVGVNSWRKPVVKRLRAGLNQNYIDEELWALLVKQEEEIKSNKSDTVCRNEIEWLDLEVDVDVIVQEIQSLLIDGIIEEFVSMEM